MRRYGFIRYITAAVLCVALLSGCVKAKPAADVPGQETEAEDGEDPGKAIRDSVLEQLQKEKEAPEEEEEPEKEEETEEEETLYTDEAIEEDGVYAYSDVLEEIFGVYHDGYDYSVEYKYFPIGMQERIMYDEGNFLDDVGFAMTDISGDGIPELLIGEDMGFDKGYTLIYGCYTRKNGEVIRTFEGWARNSHSWMGDGHFCYQGSDSAWSSLFGEAHISRDGTELVWDDFYFSDMASDDPNDGIVYFHNKSGFYDKNAPDNELITQEEFVDLMDAYMKKGKNLSMYPLKNLDTEGFAEGEAVSDIDVMDRITSLTDVLALYKEAQENRYTVEMLKDAGLSTGLFEHGWPENAEADALEYVYHDIDNGGKDELIILYNGKVIEVYAEYNDKVRQAISVYDGSEMTMYEDGYIRNVYPADTVPGGEYWSMFNSQLGDYLPLFESFNDSDYGKQYYTFYPYNATEEEYREVVECVYETGYYPVYFLEWSGELTKSEYEAILPDVPTLKLEGVQPLSELNFLHEYEPFLGGNG